MLKQRRGSPSQVSSETEPSADMHIRQRVSVPPTAPTGGQQSSAASGDHEKRGGPSASDEKRGPSVDQLNAGWKVALLLLFVLVEAVKHVLQQRVVHKFSRIVPQTLQVSIDLLTMCGCFALAGGADLLRRWRGKRKDTVPREDDVLDAPAEKQSLLGAGEAGLAGSPPPSTGRGRKGRVLVVEGKSVSEEREGGEKGDEDSDHSDCLNTVFEPRQSNPAADNEDAPADFLYEEDKLQTLQCLEASKIAVFFPTAMCYGIGEALGKWNTMLIPMGLAQIFKRSRMALTMIGSSIFLKRRYTATQWLAIVGLLSALVLFGTVHLQSGRGGGGGGGNKSAQNSDSTVTFWIAIGIISATSLCFVTGNIVFEAIAKRNDRTPFYVQACQSYIGQFCLSVCLLFALPYVGLLIDGISSRGGDTNKPSLAKTSSLFTYRAVVPVVSDWRAELREVLGKTGAIEKEREEIMKILEEHAEGATSSKNTAGGTEDHADESSAANAAASTSLATAEEQTSASSADERAKHAALADQMAAYFLAKRQWGPQFERQVEKTMTGEDGSRFSHRQNELETAKKMRELRDLFAKGLDLVTKSPFAEQLIYQQEDDFRHYVCVGAGPDAGKKQPTIRTTTANGSFLDVPFWGVYARDEDHDSYCRTEKQETQASDGGAVVDVRICLGPESVSCDSTRSFVVSVGIDNETPTAAAGLRVEQNGVILSSYGATDFGVVTLDRTTATDDDSSHHAQQEELIIRRGQYCEGSSLSSGAGSGKETSRSRPSARAICSPHSCRADLLQGYTSLSESLRARVVETDPGRKFLYTRGFFSGWGDELLCLVMFVSVTALGSNLLMVLIMKYLSSLWKAIGGGLSTVIVFYVSDFWINASAEAAPPAFELQIPLTVLVVVLVVVFALGK